MPPQPRKQLKQEPLVPWGWTPGGSRALEDPTPTGWQSQKRAEGGEAAGDEEPRAENIPVNEEAFQEEVGVVGLGWPGLGWGRKERQLSHCRRP